MIVLTYLVLSWLLCYAVGWGVARILLAGSWQRERTLLAPLFGAAVLVLLSSFFSYAGLAMRTAAPFVAATALALSGIARMVDRRRRLNAGGWRVPLFVHAVGFVGGASALLGVLLYHAWNPYNDTFTYVSIADVLQRQGFFAKVVPTGAQPLLTQIWLYQERGFRMGSTFLLAFFTGLFRVDYSFDVYPAVLSLGLWLGVPGFWVLCRRGLFMSLLAAVLATVLYALHTAIPVTNALWGFMPQTWGMAFLMALLPLHLRVTSRGDRPRRIAAAGILFGALLLTYTEIVPFALIAIGVTFLARLARGRLRLRSAVVAAAGPVAVAVGVAPVAAWYFVPTVLLQAGLVVGWDPQLSLFDYFGLVSGYRSMADARMLSLGALGALYRLGAIAAVLTATFAAFRGPASVRRQAGSIGAGFVIALGWFALCATNPWTPTEAGQPWSTYKAVTYSFFLFAALWGVGLAALWRRSLFRPLVIAQLAGVVTLFPSASLLLADVLAKPIRMFTGNNENPIGEYKRLPALVADQPPDRPIPLNIPSAALRHRQMVAYFLRRPLIADWSDDSYIFPHLSNAPGPALDPRAPMLMYAPGTSSAAVANLVRQPLRASAFVASQFGAGWYGREQDATNSWHWLEQQGELELTVAVAVTLTAHFHLAIIGPEDRTLTMTVDGHSESVTSETQSPGGFEPIVAKPIQLAPGRHRVLISVDGPVHVMSPNDLRKVRAGVRNLSWTITSDGIESGAIPGE